LTDKLIPSERAKLLPIYDCEDKIIEAVSNNRVVVVEGPTGSGKTTQIPRILKRALDIRRIGVTQPRRIAAVSVAWRIAAEEEVELGNEVGYSIRFDNQSSAKTAIKLMTDGILLMEARTDPELRSYDVIMIDEAHERSLNIDVILGLIHRVLQHREDLRVIVSSATLCPEQFQNFFAPVVGKVPRVSIPGRTHPIEVQYRPLRSHGPMDVTAAVADEVVYLHRYHEPGHILVFLSGAAGIRHTEMAIEERWMKKDMVILPLYARMTREEQERVFDDFGDQRKVVLATNIAETSITIPDVRYVIDTGLAKVPYYSPRTHIKALREQPISRSSAEQRAGRAGRTGPGVAVRLYSEESFSERPERQMEEILRLDLSEVVLRLIDLGISQVEDFPFPTEPTVGKVHAALDTLFALGAIDRERNLTGIGKRMVPFPLSPDLARMVIEAAERFPTVVDEVLVVGAFLSARSPFVLPEGQADAAREAHGRFHHPLGDAVAHVEVYKAWRRADQKTRFCDRNFLDPEAMAFACRAHEQLAEIATEHGIEVKSGGKQEDIVRAVAAGLADRIIVHQDGSTYETLDGVRVGLHPGCMIAGRYPLLAAAAELVEHSRKYAINVSSIRKEWLAEINPEAAKRFGIKGAVRPKVEVQKGPTHVKIGPLELAVIYGRGKPAIELSLTDLKHLAVAHTGDLEPDARSIRGRVHWTPKCAFAAVPLALLLRLAKLGVYPEAGTKEPRAQAFGELLEIDRDRHRIERALGQIGKPAVMRKSAGWIAFVANGAGGYWLDVVPYYGDALQASRLSVDALVDELYPGDALRERAELLADELEAKDVLQSGG